MRWTIYLIEGAIVFVCLLYLGRFSIRESIVLAVIFAGYASAAHTFGAKPTRRFSPFRVRIYPYWWRILVDFRVVSGDEEWDKIRHLTEQFPKTEYHILRDGLCFTVVQESEDARRIIYSDNRHAFKSIMESEEELNPIRVTPISKRESATEQPKSDIRFFMRYGQKDYELGLRVPTRWWAAVRDSCPRPVREDEDHPTGRVDLVLALIPFAEFDYWQPLQWSAARHKRILSEANQLRGCLASLGWKSIEIDPDVRSELGLHSPEILEHKYFYLEHQDI